MTSRGYVYTTTNEGVANRELNAGRPTAWPVWKERLFGNHCVNLYDLGFHRIGSTLDLKRIQHGISAVVSPPSAFEPGVLRLQYIDARLGSVCHDIDEVLAERILKGWDNSALLAEELPLPHFC